MIAGESLTNSVVKRGDALFWANATFGANAAEVRAFESNLAVRLIATDRGAFKTCAANERVVEVAARNRKDGFDHLPVVETTAHESARADRIVGLLDMVALENDPLLQGLVHERMRPLSEENLIGADAGILSFIRTADHQPCRLIISGPEISGLVSISDLQRLPVRAALFTVVTHLEMVMANVIRGEFEDSDRWLDRLPEGRRLKLRAQISASKESNTFVQSLLLTQFCDKANLIQKSPSFRWSKSEFKSNMKRIESLGNDLAHANNYAADRGAAQRLCGTVRIMDRWLDRLAAFSGNRLGVL